MFRWFQWNLCYSIAEKSLVIGSWLPSFCFFLSFLRELEFDDEVEKRNGLIDKDAIAQRLEEIYKRLEAIDAYSEEAHAASILAGQKLNSYKGNYDLFERTHDEQIENF
ncbi:ABC transporter F family member 3-like isoform X2 [Mangifera indica]|uniref:ABC transporter F family member 3-like isoform X2 n=1 Tax=Mangifera indica TaxID=29780 RepID=UPI001CF9527F|nr:ABC transporter F family member 3-like isoform X2 [Mangifera indica]